MVFSFISNYKGKLRNRLKAEFLIKAYKNNCLEILASNESVLSNDNKILLNSYLSQTSGKATFKLHNKEYDNKVELNNLCNWLEAKKCQFESDLKMYLKRQSE